jgi:hypothetical protein
MENLNLSLAKYILGVNKRANNLAARSELGRYPIGNNMILATFSFLQHVEKSSNILLLKALESSKENKGQCITNH